MNTIICFGDSITRGENDSEFGGWVNRLSAFYMSEYASAKQNETCVYNLGIGGQTTSDLLLRFENELSYRISTTGKNTIILSFGANDLATYEDINLVCIAEYIQNLAACIEYGSSMKAEILLMNILPMTNSAITKRTDIHAYNQSLHQLAIDKNIKVIDVYQAFNNADKNLFTFDGVHPNADGHRIIFETVLKIANNTRLQQTGINLFS